MSTEVIAALIGVGFGFLLTVCWSAVERWLERHRWVKAIEKELQTNLKIIGDKLDILGKMQAALAKEKLLAGQSVHVVSTAYDMYFHAIYGTLSPIQRENLNIIYGQLKIADVLLDNFEKDLIAMIEFAKNTFQVNPFEVFRNKLQNIEENYHRIGELIQSYLAGKPVNVHGQPWSSSNALSPQSRR